MSSMRVPHEDPHQQEIGSIMHGGTWYNREWLSKMSNAELVDAFEIASSVGNEMDNRDQIEMVRKVLLQRLQQRSISIDGDAPHL